MRSSKREEAYEPVARTREADGRLAGLHRERSRDNPISYVIPKRKVPVKLHLLDEVEPRNVEFFLADGAAGYQLPERPSDLLRDAEPFFAVSEGANRFLVRRGSVRVASVSVEHELVGELTVEDLAGDSAQRAEVVVSLVGGLVLRGTSFFILPEGKRRMLDFLNLPETFFALRDGESIHLVNKVHVLHVAVA